MILNIFNYGLCSLRYFYAEDIFNKYDIDKNNIQTTPYLRQISSFDIMSEKLAYLMYNKKKNRNQFSIIFYHRLN